MSDSSSHLYRVGVQSDASPGEVNQFCEILEENGYAVVTDMSAGRLDIHDEDGGGR
jgi:hypothetical protein